MSESNPPSSGAPPAGATPTEERGPDLADRSQEARERLQRHYRDIEQTYGETRARLEGFNEQATAFIRQNPGICIAGAAAAGYVIGRLAARRWLV